MLPDDELASFDDDKFAIYVLELLAVAGDGLGAFVLVVLQGTAWLSTANRVLLQGGN